MFNYNKDYIMAVKSPNSAGRPASAGMSADSIKVKIAHEITKANRNAANNLGKYFAQLEKYALGAGSDTNTISSCKMFIEMAQSYLEEEVVVAEESESVEVETKQVGNGGPVESFAEKKEAWAKKQAEKKAQEG
jgi:hypothetical protein